MKTLYKYLLVMIAIPTIITGCSDHFELAPLDAPSNVTFYSNQDQLILALNGAYRQTLYLNFYNTAFEQIENTTDNGFERGHGGLKSIALGSHNSTTNVCVAFWTHLYRAISRVNNLLDNMYRAEDVVPADFFQRVQAEARFLRAFSYFYLSELYGDVPLITEVPDPDHSHLSRTPKENVVDQIIADLDFAAQVLPESWGGNDVGRATKGAALALKARVALFNGRFDLAAQAAKEVMNMGVYSLYPDFESLTLYAGKRSSEVIFDIPFKEGVQVSSIPRRRGTQTEPSWSTTVPSQFLVDIYECIDGKPIDESPLYDPANPFENRDPRLGGTIILPQTIWGKYIIEYHPDSVEKWIVDEAGNKIGRRENRDVTSAYSTFTGYLWRKYCDWNDFPDKGGNVDRSENNFILMRYAEVLQIYAEARIESGNIDQSVLDAINKVRARGYGVNLEETSQYPAVTTTDQSELRKIIRRERRAELAGEGLRIFDIRRWRIAEYVMNGIFLGRPDGLYSIVSSPPEIDDHGHPNYGDAVSLYWNVEPRVFNPNRDYLWPIPQAEIDVNTEMTQNPGY